MLAPSEHSRIVPCSNRSFHVIFDVVTRTLTLLEKKICDRLELIRGFICPLSSRAEVETAFENASIRQVIF